MYQKIKDILYHGTVSEVSGKTGSEEAKRILLHNLEPENLGVQYYIGKQEVADRLIISIEEIEWR